MNYGKYGENSRLRNIFQTKELNDMDPARISNHY